MFFTKGGAMFLNIKRFQINAQETFSIFRKALKLFNLKALFLFLFLMSSRSSYAQQLVPSGLKVALTVSVPKSIAQPSGEKELLEAVSLNIQLNLVAHVSSGGHDYFCPLLKEDHVASSIVKGAINLNFADTSVSMGASRSFASSLGLIASDDQQRMLQILTQDFLGINMSCYDSNNSLVSISADIYKSSSRFIFISFTAQNKALESINIQTLLPVGSNFYSQLAQAAYQFIGSSLAIGTPAADSSAILDLASTTQGLLLPRMNIAQRDSISSPATGLQIYNTATNQINFYDGTSWQSLGVSGSGVTSVSSANGDISIANGSTTPQLTLNSSATGGAGSAGKVAKLDGSGLLASSMIPTLAESQIPNLDASKITVGTLPVSRGGTGSSASLSNNRVIISSGSNIVEAPAILADKVLVSNANGLPIASSVTATELGYLAGLSSSVQTQLNSRLSATVTLPNLNDLLRYNGSTWINSTADASGLVDKSSIQTITGAKTFSGALNVSNSLTVNSANELKFNDSDDTQYVSLRAPPTNLLTSNVSFVLPSSAGLNGEVLKVDGLGNMAWGADNGTPAGAVGQIQFYSSSTSFGADSNLYWDNANDRLGVGQPSPQSKVHVNGAVVTTTNVVATGGNINLALSNTHILNSVGDTTITLSNPVNGGNYTIIVADTTARTYTFNGCSQRYFSPTNGDTTAGTRSVYGIMTIDVSGSWHCYITWASDFN